MSRINNIFIPKQILMQSFNNVGPQKILKKLFSANVKPANPVNFKMFVAKLIRKTQTTLIQIFRRFFPKPKRIIAAKVQTKPDIQSQRIMSAVIKELKQVSVKAKKVKTLEEVYSKKSDLTQLKSELEKIQKKGIKGLSKRKFIASPRKWKEREKHFSKLIGLATDFSDKEIRDEFFKELDKAIPKGSHFEKSVSKRLGTKNIRTLLQKEEIKENRKTFKDYQKHLSKIYKRLKQLGRKSRKISVQQEYPSKIIHLINEIKTTEESYGQAVKNLKAASEKALQNDKENTELKSLVKTFSKLHQCNLKFKKQLRGKKTVSSIIEAFTTQESIDNLTMLSAYSCTYRNFANRKLEPRALLLLESAHAKITGKEKILGSDLIQPVQRLMRYPLLIRDLAKPGKGLSRKEEDLSRKLLKELESITQYSNKVEKQIVGGVLNPNNIYSRIRPSFTQQRR